MRASELPKDSLLHGKVAQGDFLDCYVVAADLPARRAAEIVTDFPWWAQLLLKLRHIVTAPFGLSQEGPPSTNRVGIFPVDQETPQELTAGFNDTHLDFRVCVYSDHGRVYLATWVHPHNAGGRLYLSAILPFHILIARNGLARVRNAAQRG